MPSAGVFVRERVGDDASIHVVAPRRYDGSIVARYLRLLLDALTMRGKFDGVEAHVLFPTGVIGLLAARIRRLPLVVYVHGDEVRNAVYRNRFFTWLGKRVSRAASAIVVNSRDTAVYTARLGGPEPVINPPGVDLQRFRPTPRPTERRVLYVGGDRPEKGVDIARELADTVVGPYLHEVPPEDMPNLMARHDVLLMPSREEAFGVAAAEAIASGRWPVANAVGGLLDVIRDGVNGTLVGDDDYRAALAAVPDYDPEAVAMTAQGFDIRRHRAGLAAIWRSVLHGVSADGVERLQPPTDHARGSVGQEGQ
jgi:glycosyltransferase involved in cell wall biosynthesis